MIALKVILLVSLPCISAFFLRRDSLSIIQRLALADSYTKNGTTAANNITGPKYSNSIGDAIGNITIANQNVIAATNDVRTTAASITLNICQGIIDYMNSPFEPDVKALNNALIAKKSDLTTEGVAADFCSVLKSSKADIDYFTGNLSSVCPANLRPAISNSKANFDADYNAGISNFC